MKLLILFGLVGKGKFSGIHNKKTLQDCLLLMYVHHSPFEEEKKKSFLNFWQPSEKGGRQNCTLNF